MPVSIFVSAEHCVAMFLSIVVSSQPVWIRYGTGSPVLAHRFRIFPQGDERNSILFRFYFVLLHPSFSTISRLWSRGQNVCVPQSQYIDTHATGKSVVLMFRAVDYAKTASLAPKHALLLLDSKKIQLSAKGQHCI